MRAVLVWRDQLIRIMEIPQMRAVILVPVWTDEDQQDMHRVPTSDYVRPPRVRHAVFAYMPVKFPDGEPQIAVYEEINA